MPPLQPRRPLQRLRAQGESLLLGHITQHECLVCPGMALFCCSIVVCLAGTVLMFLFRIMLPLLSLFLSCLCFFEHVFLADLCVCPCVLLRKLWLLSLSWGQLKERDWAEGGHESAVIDSICGSLQYKTHTHILTLHPRLFVHHCRCLIRDDMSECSDASGKNQN